jgi:hypothetical protein
MLAGGCLGGAGGVDAGHDAVRVAAEATQLFRRQDVDDERPDVRHVRDYFAEVLLDDQGTAATRARDELDWHPARPSLVSEFRHGSYRR